MTGERRRVQKHKERERERERERLSRVALCGLRDSERPRVDEPIVFRNHFRRYQREICRFRAFLSQVHTRDRRGDPKGVNDFLRLPARWATTILLRVSARSAIFASETSRGMQCSVARCLDEKKEKKKRKGKKRKEKEGDRQARERSARRVDSNEISIRRSIHARA